VQRVGDSRGFSLVEMLIASAILLIGVAGILLSLPNAERGVAEGAMAGRAALYAAEQLELLEALPLEELQDNRRLAFYEDRPEGLFWRRWWVLDAGLRPELEDPDELAEALAEYDLQPGDLDLPRGFLRLKVRLDWTPPRGRPQRLEVGELLDAAR
jgi:prepilin-type N-terminal cleavage/methylation domain-containing protein